MNGGKIIPVFEKMASVRNLFSAEKQDNLNEVLVREGFNWFEKRGKFEHFS